MRKTVSCVVALVLGLAFALPSRADEPDYARPGFYLGLGPSFILENFDNEFDAKDSWGFTGRAGVRVTKNFALDVAADFFDEFNTNNGDVGGFAIGLNGKVYPLTGRFQPYATVGLGAYRLISNKNTFGSGLNFASSDNATEVMGRLGGGLDAYVTENIAVFAEVVYLLSDAKLSDFQSAPVSFGILYRR